MGEIKHQNPTTELKFPVAKSYMEMAIEILEKSDDPAFETSLEAAASKARLIDTIEAAIHTLNSLEESQDSSAEFWLQFSIPNGFEIWADGVTNEDDQIVVYSHTAAEEIWSWVMREIWTVLRGSEYAEFNPEI